MVEGQTTIIMIKPEGTPVKKGEIVCVLDSAALKDSLLNQKITTKSAKAAWNNATLTREVAEIAVVEYIEGIYKQDLATVRGRDQAGRVRPVPGRGPPRLGAADVQEGVRLAGGEELRRADAQEEPGSPWSRPRARRTFWSEYTKGKTIKELKSEVEKAHSDELAKKATWDLENTQGEEARAADRRLRDQGPERRPGGLRQRSQPVVRQQPASDRGRGDRPRATEDLQPAGYQQDAGEHEGPRIACQPGQARA